MNEIRVHRPNWIFRVAMVLLCMMLISVWLMSGLLARYTAGGTGADEARVASFNVTADLQNFEVTFPVRLKPGGNPVTCSFDITNSSETAISMQALLETEGNLPLKIEYKEGDTGSWNPLMDNIQEEPEGTEGICTWTDEFAAGTAEKQTYWIQISWPGGRNGYQYANGVEAVKLSVTASQID